MVTRPEALDKAIAWAESAHRCYTRAAQAREDARLSDTGRPPVALPSANVRRLTHTADAEYRHSQIEAALATAWAAIAAVSHDQPHFHVHTPEESQP